jgi:hypothetical protein
MHKEEGGNRRTESRNRFRHLMLASSMRRHVHILIDTWSDLAASPIHVLDRFLESDSSRPLKNEIPLSQFVGILQISQATGPNSAASRS